MRVLLTTHVQPIPGLRPSASRSEFLSIPLSWFYAKPGHPQQGIDFADEERHAVWEK